MKFSSWRGGSRLRAWDSGFLLAADSRFTACVETAAAGYKKNYKKETFVCDSSGFAHMDERGLGDAPPLSEESPAADDTVTRASAAGAEAPAPPEKKRKRKGTLRTLIRSKAALTAAGGGDGGRRRHHSAKKRESLVAQAERLKKEAHHEFHDRLAEENEERRAGYTARKYGHL